MSLYDTVAGLPGKALDTLSGFSDSVGGWFRDLGNFGPLLALKMSNAAIDAGVKVGQGAPLAPTVAQTVQQFARGGSLADSIQGTIDAAPDGWLGSMKSADELQRQDERQKAAAADVPLWVKFTIAGAVLIGTAVMLQSLMQGGRRAA